MGFKYWLPSSNMAIKAVLSSALLAAVLASPIPDSVPAYGPPPPAYPDEVPVYKYTYAVKDDYSFSNFNAHEERDGYNTAGGYQVALPDGGTQIVTYTATKDGYVADVTYQGEAKYPEYNPVPAPAYKAAPAPAYKPAPAPVVKVVPAVKAAPVYHAAPAPVVYKSRIAHPTEAPAAPAAPETEAPAPAVKAEPATEAPAAVEPVEVETEAPVETVDLRTVEEPAEAAAEEPAEEQAAYEPAAPAEE